MRIFLTVFASEFRHFVAHRRSLHLLPAAVLGVIVTATGSMGDPFLPALLASLAGLETQFNTVFARSPRERSVLVLLPAPPAVVVAAKNSATLLLASAAFLVMAAATAPFLHEPPASADLLHSAAQLGTLLFPLLILGNSRSLGEERLETGWQVTDLSEAFGMLVTALLFSIPFWIVRAAWASPLPTVILILTGGTVWIVGSVPGTAARVTGPAPEERP